MMQPVLDPVLSRQILARYANFASSVGAPAPMEHLAPAAPAAQRTPAPADAAQRVLPPAPAQRTLAPRCV